MRQRRFTVPAIVSIAALFVLVGASSSVAKPTLTLTPEVSSGGLGGRSAINVTLRVAGTEYGGYPPPVTGVVLDLPSGTTVGAGDHPTCSKEVLERSGPNGCAAGSRAGPAGNALTIVSFGAERVEEFATVESFFASGGGLMFFLDGHTPTSLEILSSATVASNVATLSVPLISTVPGAPYAAVEDLRFELGESTAEEANTHLESGVILPSECPTGKLSWAATVTFDENGSEPTVPETVETATETGCPSVSPEELQRRREKEAEAAAKKKAEEEAARDAEEALDKRIIAALLKAIAPGKPTRLAPILKKGGFDLDFDSPVPGTLLVDWYEIPKGAHLSSKARPILVARGRVNFAASGSRRVLIRLTSKGKQLIKHVRSIKLTAMGLFTPTGKAPVVLLRRFTLRR
jgi:hypothetical protein